MLDAAASDMAGAAGSSSLSSPLSATDPAAITIAVGLLETTTHPPLSIDVNVPATAITTAANVANNTRHNFFANIDGSPPPVYAGWDANQRAWHNNGLADTQPPSGPHDHEVRDRHWHWGRRWVRGTATGRDPCGEIWRCILEDVHVKYRIHGEYGITPEGGTPRVCIVIQGEQRGGVRRDINITRGTTVPLVIRKHQTGKTVVGRNVPRVLHRRHQLQGQCVHARMAGWQPSGMEQLPPDTHRHIHETRGRKDCT
jgi:hypothetical protein